MNINQVSAVLFPLSVILLWTAIFLLKKSNQKANAVSWMIISIMTVLCLLSAEGKAFDLLHIPININFFSVLHFAIVIVLLTLIIKKRQIQSYELKKADIIALIVIGVAVLWVSQKQFGTGLNTFNYQCGWDSAVHVINGRNTATQSTLGITQYFMSLPLGLLMQCVMAFAPNRSGCQIFIYIDICMLWLAGSMFWILCRKTISQKYLLVIGMAFSILYMIGYPLNNMVFGTSYLGAGTTIVIYLIIILDYLENNMIRKKNAFVLICIGFFGLLVAYILFIPIMLGVFCVVGFRELYIRGKLSKKRIFAILITGVLITIGLLLFILIGWGGFSGLKNEGQMYRNFYSNFIFFIPFVFFSFYDMIRKRKICKEYVILAMTIFFLIILFVGVIKEFNSSYYYFKPYYVLWFSCFYVTFCIIEKHSDQFKVFSIYLISWLCLFVMWFSNVDIKLNSYIHAYYGEKFGVVNTSQYFDLYTFNRKVVNHLVLIDSVRELFLQSKEITNTSGEAVCYVGNYSHAVQKQFYAVANQPEFNFFEDATPEECIDSIKENCGYVCVLINDEIPLDISSYLQTLEVIYSNDQGYIAKVK